MKQKAAIIKVEKRTKKTNAFTKLFECLNKLIEVNEYKHLCNQQIKLDRTKS